MLIWDDNIKLPQNLYNEIVNIVEKNYINNVAGLQGRSKEKYYTSFYKDTDKIAHVLSPYYQNLIKKIMRDLGMFKISKYTYQIWVQMYNSETNTHKPHSHFSGNEIISFNHIINASKNKCFYFIDDYGNKIYPGEQKSGDIFAWPSWLMHGAVSYTHLTLPTKA